MFTIKALSISIAIPPECDIHNHDLVGYVISKYPRKVLKVSILNRDSVEDWFSKIAKQYPKDKHVFLVGTVSLVGEVLALVDTGKEVNTSAYNAKRDTNAN